MDSASVYDLMVIRSTLVAASEGKSLLEQGTTWGKSLTQEMEGLRDFPELVCEFGDALGSSSASGSGYIRKGEALIRTSIYLSIYNYCICNYESVGCY